MKTALALALNGEGRVAPNPLVGAVIVKNNEIVGRGYHVFFGGAHAEVEAVHDALRRGCVNFGDATLYVTLEPCCHRGKTPPCTELIMKTGIRNVVVGAGDPNPLVAGKGIAALRTNGISVTEGILERECRSLNRVFNKFITTGKPFVLLKSACSLDGKTATSGGESKWISCEESRRDSLRLRGRHMAVMCGVGTVRADDPMLTTRTLLMPNPVRIIADSSLSIPLASKIVRTAKDIPTIVATCSGADARELEDAGITVIRTAPRGGRVHLAELMSLLGARGISGILLEGGATLAFSALEGHIVDRVRYYIAPMLIGGSKAKGAVGGEGFTSLALSCRISSMTTERCGTDLVVEGDLCLPE